MPQKKKPIKKVKDAGSLSKEELIEELNNAVGVNQIYATALMVLWDTITVLASKEGKSVNYGDLARLVKNVESSYIDDVNNQLGNKVLDQNEADFLVDNIKNSTYVIWSTFLSVVPMSSDMTQKH